MKKKTAHLWRGLKRAYRRYLNRATLDQTRHADVLNRALRLNPPEFQRITGRNYSK